MSQDGSQLPPSRSMSSLYAVDSAMCDTSHSSNSALATVEEEAAPRKLKLQGVPSSAEPKHEMEMAVRRGKNLYTGGVLFAWHSCLRGKYGGLEGG